MKAYSLPAGHYAASWKVDDESRLSIKEVTELGRQYVEAAGQEKEDLLLQLTRLSEKLDAMETLPAQLKELNTKVETLIQANIRQEAVNRDVDDLKVKVTTLRTKSIFIRGGIRTLGLLGTALSAVMLFIYHIAVVFFPHKG
jgi:hypothetical protein